MNLIEMTNIIDEFNTAKQKLQPLEVLVKDRISFIKQFDDKYSTRNNITDITFNDNDVVVTCFDKINDCEFSFSFPLEWLILPYYRLQEIIIYNKNERIRQQFIS